MLSLRGRLLTTLLLAGLIPAMIISYQTFVHNSEQVKSYSIESSKTKLKSVAQSLTHSLNEAKKLTKIYARDSRVQSMDYAEFMPFLKSELGYLTPEYEKFIVGKLNGEFFNTAGANLLQGGIRTFDDKSAASKPKNIRARDYWQATVIDAPENTARTYVSNPMISFTTGVKQVVVATTIVDTQNQRAGMIGLSIGWQRINKLLNRLIKDNFSHLGYRPKVMLVAQDGTYWYHWEEDKVIQLLKDENGNAVLNELGEKEVQKSNILESPNPELQAIGRKMTAAQHGAELIQFEKQRQHVIYLPVEGSPYSLGLILDEDIILAPVYKTLEFYILVLIACSLTILLVGYLMARYFSQPIAELIQKTTLLSEGKFADPESQTSIKELNLLSRSIFELYEKINQQSEKIRVSSERISLMLKSSNDGIWDWNLETGSLYLAPRWKEIIGYTDEELPSSQETFNKHTHPDDRHMVDQLFKDFITGRAEFTQCRFRMIHKNGSTVSILTRALAVRNENKIATRLIGTNTDISDLVARENEVLELNKALETKVKQRTHELEDALKTAQKANEAKSTFLSNMSHEIRTPMNGIMGLTALCLQTPLNEQQKDYLEKVMSSSKTLLKILNEILDFNKVESNMIELENKPVAMSDVIDEVNSLMRPAADDKGLEFSTHISDDIPAWIMSDQIRLTQVLINLVGNAIKFTNQGRVSIEVNRGTQEQHDGRSDELQVCFSISDTGIGIKDTKDLFTPFKQEDVSTTRRFGGTGLGLSISKRLVELMGGELHIETEVGKGSRFSFELTLKEATPPKQTVNTSEAKATDDYRFEELSVLIVEDNQVNQIIAEEMLVKTGCTTALVENGQQALDYLEEHPVNLILLDIQMPVMDGITAIKHIKDNLLWRNIPVIAMTANVMDHEVDNYFNLGFSAVIGKPFSQQEMLKTISKALNTSS